MRELTYSTAYLQVLVDALAEAGASWRTLCERSGIDPALFDDPNAHISGLAVLRLFREAGRELGEAALGLRLGALARPRFANVVFYLLISSETLHEGLERVARYQRALVEGGRFALVEEDAGVFVRFRTLDIDANANRNFTEYANVLLLKYCRWVVDLDFHPIEARFRHQMPDPTEHERVFGCPARFGAPATGLLLQRDVLERPSAFAHPELAREHELFAKRFLGEVDSQRIAQRLRGMLVPLLESGGLELRTAARGLGMSSRTLQRRLAGEGTSFAKLADDIRQEIAEDQLLRTSASVDEIAYLTGYSEVSSFERAFKRWTRQTPSQFRRAHR